MELKFPFSPGFLLFFFFFSSWDWACLSLLQLMNLTRDIKKRKRKKRKREWNQENNHLKRLVPLIEPLAQFKQQCVDARAPAHEFLHQPIVVHLLVLLLLPLRHNLRSRLV